MKNITVFASSANPIDNVYLSSAYELGKNLALCSLNMVYGGGKTGLMGAVADGMLSQGGKVTGVIPDFMIERELAHNSIDKLLIVNSMHERQFKMIQMADVIVALPGGSGTFTELFEAITWKRLGLINSPIIIVNINEYYNEMIKILNKAIDVGFMRKTDNRIWKIADSVSETVRILFNDSEIIYNYDMV